MSGFPVVIVDKGGAPFVAVTSGAPVATVAASGVPITLVDSGAPALIVEGMVDFGWQTIDLTAGEEQGQWIGFSDGGATRPQPAFGSISGQPTTVTNLLALYDDTNSDVYLAVFAGDYVTEMAGINLVIGGFPIAPFEIELISGNTWLRYNGTGDMVDGAVYQIDFA